MPEVGIFEGAANAFATGWNKNDALVAVSTGLPDQRSAHWFFNDPATTEIYTLSLHDALPI